MCQKQHEKRFELFVTSRLNAYSGLEANWPNSLSKDDKAQSFIGRTSEVAKQVAMGDFDSK